MNWTEPDSIVLSLLLAGQAIVDFGLTDRGRLGRARPERATWTRHLVLAGVAHLAVLLVVPTAAGAVLAVALVGAYAGLDVVMERLGAGRDDRVSPSWPLRSWCADRVLRIAATGLASSLWMADRDARALAGLAALALLVAALLFLGRGGSTIVEGTLGLLAPAPGSPDEPAAAPRGPHVGAGTLIGMLERWIVLGLALGGQWGAIGLVLTAKSVARFKRMEEQAFAEAYLVGTMTSVGLAMLVGTLLRFTLLLGR